MTETLALIMLSAFVVMFYLFPKPYDLPTAIFFTLALTLMARGRFLVYLLVFFLSCLNRETTILLLPIFMTYYRGRIDTRRYWLLVLAQLALFALVQGTIRYLFRDAPGWNAWITPVQNLIAYGTNPLRTLTGIVVAVVVLWRVFEGWHGKPVFLRTSFAIMVPVLFVLFVVAGQPFEYRVFAEVFSVTAMLVFPSMVKI